MLEDEGNFPSSNLREYSLGNLGTEHRDVYVHSVLVQDPEVRELLSEMASMYDPTRFDETPSSFWDTKFAKRVLRKCGTDLASRAVANGMTGVLDFITGLPDYNADISGVKTIQQLSDWITRTAGISLISGHMGSGKTDFACLLGEIWKHEMRNDEQSYLIASNIESLEQAETIKSMSELKSRVEKDDNERVLMIWDEASSHASGYGSDRGDVEDQLRRFVRMIRKNQGSLIMIGHAEGGKDIHPDVRRLCEAVYKENKKKATVYRGINEKREYEGEKFDLDGIPPTSWNFDTLEESSWEWDLDTEEMDDEDNDEDMEKIVIEQCIGEKASGGRCGCSMPGRDVDQETGTCNYHSIEDESDLAVEVEEIPQEVLENLPIDGEREEDDEEDV